MCVSEASTAKEIGALGTGCKRMSTLERGSQARRKVASQGVVQSNSLKGLLRSVVKGAKIDSAFLINFL